MAKRLTGQVALITGGARGVGRSHALTLAAEGADIVLCDTPGGTPTVSYGVATADDLAGTAAEIAALGRRCIAADTDVRDRAGLRELAARAVRELGRLDIVLANAGICTFGPAWELTDEQWDDMIAVNLTGVFNTVRACVPHLIEAGRGGSVVVTSSIAGLWATPNVSHYVAAKHGVTGFMKALAIELGPHSIRVNAVHPGTVQTQMVVNQAGIDGLVGHPDSSIEEARPLMQRYNVLPVAMLEPSDISRAVLYLVSDDGRYVTGTSMVVDAGASVCPPGEWR